MRKYPNKVRTPANKIIITVLAVMATSCILPAVFLMVAHPAGMPVQDSIDAIFPWIAGGDVWAQFSALWPSTTISALAVRMTVIRDGVAGVGTLGLLWAFLTPDWVDKWPLEDGPRFFPPPNGASAARRLFAVERRAQGKGMLLAPGVHLPKEREVKGIDLIGRPGSGKTVVIRYLCEQILAMPASRAIVLDFKGDFTSDWPSSDFVLMAPHDGRVLPSATQPYAMGWDIAADASTEAACWTLAGSLIPDGRGEAMWTKGARAVMVGFLMGLNKTLYSRTLKRATWTWRDFRDVMNLSDVEMWEFLDRHYPQARRMANLDKSEQFTKTSLSFIVNVVACALEIVGPLADAWGDVPLHRLLSLRQWVLTPQKSDARTIILQFSGEYAEISMAWMSAVIRSLIQLGQSARLANDKARRVFFVLDELPAISRENDQINRLLEVGRSKGFGLIAGYQTFEQAEKAWGKEVAHSVAGNVGTKLIGALGNIGVEGVAASRASAMAGKAQVRRTKHQRNYGRDRSRSVSNDLSLEETAPGWFFETIKPTRDGVEMCLIEGGKVMMLRWPYDTWATRRRGVVPTPAFERWVSTVDKARWAEIQEAAANDSRVEAEATRRRVPAWRRTVRRMTGPAVATALALVLVVFVFGLHGLKVVWPTSTPAVGDRVSIPAGVPLFDARTGHGIGPAAYRVNATVVQVGPSWAVVRIPTAAVFSYSLSDGARMWPWER